jgi:WD40 repeat protein
LPARPNEISIQQPDPAIDHPNVASLVVPVPPLPPGDIIIAAQNGNIAPNGVNDSAPGQFVANDAIDEGVKLLSKLQHGPAESETNGAGTRARRRTVKVICVARSPLGQQFATGSDDGVCRIWEDQGDKNVEKVDSTSFLLNSRGGDTRGTPQLGKLTMRFAREHYLCFGSTHHQTDAIQQRPLQRSWRL